MLRGGVDVPRARLHIASKQKNPLIHANGWAYAIMRSLLSPPPAKSVIAAATEEDENHNDNQDGFHSFLQL
jgi:hypothetical protein